jgi:hypothetical protein
MKTVTIPESLAKRMASYMGVAFWGAFYEMGLSGEKSYTKKQMKIVERFHEDKEAVERLVGDAPYIDLRNKAQVRAQR